MESKDVELLCKTLQVEHKLFYFDLKQNPRGPYLKISEKTSGSRSTIIVPLPGVVWFLDLFTYYAARNRHDFFSKELQLDNKVFYFDVGENTRGQFLKVSEASVARSRSTIIVPAGSPSEDGWAAFRDVLLEINEASQLLLPPQPGTTPTTSEHMRARAMGSCPEDDAQMGLCATDGGGVIMAKVIRAEQKRFFFDLGSNSRGQFLRISEVTGGDRSIIILPVSVIEKFHEALGQFVEITRSQRLAGSSMPNIRTVPSATASRRKFNTSSGSKRESDRNGCSSPNSAIRSYPCHSAPPFKVQIHKA